MDDQRYMRMALDKCREAIESHQAPFGACIVDACGIVLACEGNGVWAGHDPTAHAEVCAVRAACSSLRRLHLTGATIYSTTEPCPMCFAAIHWARISRIVSGASIQDAASFGFNELQVSNQALKEAGAIDIDLTQQFMRDEAVELFKMWRQNEGKAY